MEMRSQHHSVHALRCVLALGAALGVRGGEGEYTKVMEPLTGNLLVNGGPDVASMDGWIHVVNGGDGWDAYRQNASECETEAKPDECDANFKTSYKACTRRQMVSLVSDGVDGETLDSGTVAVVVSEEIREFYDVDKYFIRVMLCADDHCKHVVSKWQPCKTESKVESEEAYSWCETSGGSKDEWKTHNHVFGGAEVAGARYLRFEDGGVDSEYFKGYWGPWFRKASVTVHASNHTFAPSISPAPTAKHTPSSRPTPRPSHAPFASAWNGYGDDDGYGDNDGAEPDNSGAGDDAATKATKPPAAAKKHRHQTPEPTPKADVDGTADGGDRDGDAAGHHEGGDGDGHDGDGGGSTALNLAAAFGVLALIVGFGFGYIARCKKKGNAPDHQYAIAGSEMTDERGVEMGGLI